MFFFLLFVQTEEKSKYYLRRFHISLGTTWFLSVSISLLVAHWKVKCFLLLSSWHRWLLSVLAAAKAARVQTHMKNTVLCFHHAHAHFSTAWVEATADGTVDERHPTQTHTHPPHTGGGSSSWRNRRPMKCWRKQGCQGGRHGDQLWFLKDP